MYTKFNVSNTRLWKLTKGISTQNNRNQSVFVSLLLMRDKCYRFITELANTMWSTAQHCFGKFSPTRTEVWHFPRKPLTLDSTAHLECTISALFLSLEMLVVFTGVEVGGARSGKSMQYNSSGRHESEITLNRINTFIFLPFFRKCQTRGNTEKCDKRTFVLLLWQVSTLIPRKLSCLFLSSHCWLLLFSNDF